MAKAYIGKILERILISLSVILCMQLPFFITQYTHQLKGHLDELKWQVEQMESSAALSGKNLEQYISKFVKSLDTDFAAQGLLMRSVVHRFEIFSKAWFALKNSSSLTRPFGFFRHLQLDIVKATFNDFKMGISFTLESIVFGLIGMFVGAGLYQVGQLAFKRKKIRSPTYERCT